MAMIMLAFLVGVLLSGLFFYFGKIRQLQLEHELALEELKQQFEKDVIQSSKRSVNLSRAVLKGKLAEQFAPVFPEFKYLPSDAKFLGDPIDYVVFSGYSNYREGKCSVKDLELVFIDIKSGKAQLSDGQQALAYAIKKGRVRFETIRIDF